MYDILLGVYTFAPDDNGKFENSCKSDWLIHGVDTHYRINILWFILYFK